MQGSKPLHLRRARVDWIAGERMPYTVTVPSHVLWHVPEAFPDDLCHAKPGDVCWHESMVAMVKKRHLLEQSKAIENLYIRMEQRYPARIFRSHGHNLSMYQYCAIY